MKLLSYCLLGLLFCSSVKEGFSQTTHTIILNVNTAEIKKSNVEETCDFGQPDNVSNEDFSIEVRLGDEVKWEINAVDENPRELELINMKYERGRNLFRKEKINRQGDVIRGTVVAGAVGQSEKYSIKFKVKGKGSFVIDPKIVIKN